MTLLKAIHKHFNKSPNNSWSNNTHNMVYTPNFNSFGPREASHLNSSSQHKFKQAHTRHQNMHQLQASTRQRPNMINEWNQNHGKLQDVYDIHAKFQVHPINNKNFTNQIQSCLTRSQQLVKQGRKSQSNWKCTQKIHKNSHSNLTSRRSNMQKFRSFRVHMAW